MTNTEGQDKALDNMVKWFNRPITNDLDLLYTLNGPAGSGKTTIVKQFIEAIGKNRVVVTAPTHQAKRVINEATGFPAETTQKLLGLKPDVNMDNFNPNLPIFAPISEDMLKYYKIAIVDESSMINKAAFTLLKAKAKKYNVRILYLGDEYQLPPVNEKISLVFSSATNISTLTEIVRQAEHNPMTRILKMLRVDIQYNTNNGVKEMVKSFSNVEGTEGFKCSLKNDFALDMLNLYRSTEFKYNPDHIRFLSYTNRNVELWSEGLRRGLLKEEATKQVTNDEYLIGYKTITDENNDIVLENGETYQIVNIQYGESPQHIPGYFVKLALANGSTNVVFIVDNNHMDKFQEQYMKVLTAAKVRSIPWKKYYAFKNFHLIMKDLEIPGERPCKKDLYYSYGSTIHKSQGATFTNVALNLSNAYINPDISVRNRLIYVALSRSTDINLILVK